MRALVMPLPSRSGSSSMKGFAAAGEAAGSREEAEDEKEAEEAEADAPLCWGSDKTSGGGANSCAMLMPG